MLRAIAAPSCVVKRAAVYQGRRPEQNGGCKAGIRKWHMRRSMAGYCSGAGGVRRELCSANADVSKFCNFCSLGRSILPQTE